MPLRIRHRPVKAPAAKSAASQRAETSLRTREEQYRLLFELNPNPMWIFDEITLRFLEVNEAAVKLYGWSRAEFLRMTVKDIRPPEEVPKLAQKLNRQRGSWVAFVGEWRHWRKDHTPLDVEVTISCIHFHGSEARLTMVHDVTERKRAEKTLGRSKALSEALNEINAVLHSSLKANEIIERLIATGATALGSDTAAVALRENGGWRVSHVHGMPARFINLRLDDKTQRHAILAIKSGQPVTVADAFHDKRFDRAHLRRYNIRAVLVAPLISHDRPMGAIFFNYHRAPHEFPDTEVNFVRQLAGTASIALDNARLFEERKQTEEALRYQKTLLDSVMQTTDVMLVLLDLQFNFVWVNRAYAATCRMRPEAIVGKNHFALYPGKETEAIFRKVRDTGEAVFYKDKPFTFPDQPERGMSYWDWSLSPVKEATGAVTGLVFSLRETTKYVQAEERLRQQADMLRLSYDAILVWRLDGGIEFWNKGAEALYGFTEAEAIGRRSHELLQTVHPIPPLKIKAILNASGNWEGELRHQNKAGASVIVSSRHQLMQGADGVARVLEINRDITVRKRAEEALVRANRILLARTHNEQAMTRAEDEAEYLREVCRIIVNDCGHAMVWIGMAGHDKARSVRPVASAGFEKGYLATLKISWANNPRGRGPTGTAIRTGQPCGCQDMRADSKFAPWRKEALKRGYASSLALPLVSRQKALGVITIYSKEPHGFSDEETRLLSQLAGDVAQGLATLRLHKAHGQAAAALRENEAQMRLALHAAQAASWTWDVKGNKTFWSPEYYALYGLKPNSTPGRLNWLRHVHPDDRKTVEATIKRVLQDRQREFSFEFRIRHPVRGERWIANRGRVVYNAADGRPIVATGINLDITDRKKVEAALQEREDQYRRMFEDDLTGDFLATPSGRILLCNAAYARIYGFSNRRSAERSHLRQFNRAEWPVLVAKLRGHGSINEHQTWHRTVDGRQIHVVENLVGIFNKRKQLIQVKGYVFDDTQRKRAEEELNDLNTTLERRVAERTEELTDAYDRLRAITDNALVGILTLNERGYVQSFNPALAKMFGYSADEMANINVRQLMAGTDQLLGEEFLTHYTQTGDQRFMAIGREVLGRRKDGCAMPLELTVSDFTHGGWREFVVMVRDISQRKRLERELLEVGERERQRIGRDLHDGLGQHLHALYYMASLMEKEMKATAPERAREAGRLAKQLEHGLELSRSLARGLQPVNAVPEGLMIALRQLAERTRELYRVDSRFECRKPVLIHRHSASNHLYRIAQEAVNNAMRHGKPTEIRIQLNDARERISLRVRDNGVGIRRQAMQGQGMGLRVMRYRADAINGSLAVEKLSRGGTEVVCAVNRRVLLPLEENAK